MLTGQDQNLYFRPRRRKFLRLLSPFWLEEVMVETRLLGNRSCYRKKKKKDTNVKQNGECSRY